MSHCTPHIVEVYGGPLDGRAAVDIGPVMRFETFPGCDPANSGIEPGPDGVFRQGRRPSGEPGLLHVYRRCPAGHYHHDAVLAPDPTDTRMYVRDTDEDG